MNVSDVYNVLKQAETDYRAWAQISRQHIELDEATRNDGARRYEDRATQCAQAAESLKTA